MRLVLAAGGTGGHIFPLIAVYRRLREQVTALEAIWIGGERLEAEVVPSEGLPLISLPFYHFRASSLRNVRHNLRTLFYRVFPIAVFKSLNILRKFKPDLILSTGGYAAFPALVAAVILRVPIFIIEPNAIFGSVNRLFLRYARCAFVLTAEAALPPSLRKRLVRTGIPVREANPDYGPSDFYTNFDLDRDLPVVLVFGGSQGSTKINDAVAEMLSSKRTSPQRFQIINVVGKVVQDAAKKSGSVETIAYRPLEFIEDLPSILRFVAVVVSRAGASTVGEIIHYTVPLILVPLKSAKGGHQAANAEYLKRNGAAIVIDEMKLTGDLLHETITRVLSTDLSKRLKEALLRLKMDAAGEICGRVSQDIGE